MHLLSVRKNQEVETRTLSGTNKKNNGTDYLTEA